jgi:penicillin-insensitive murein endopeptidase
VLPEAELALGNPQEDASPGVLPLPVEAKAKEGGRTLHLDNGKDPVGNPKWDSSELLPGDSRKLTPKITLGKGGKTQEALRYQRQDRRDDETASVSIGTVTLGYLIRGKAIPISGPGYRLMERTISRGTYFGGEALVGAVERAARTVHDTYPGSILRVGNASLSKGGDISQSASHNSGRDVDLAFYVLNGHGDVVHPDRYVSFGPDGKTESNDPRSLQFDVLRNWALVEALLWDQTVQVQYIFVADWLKELLMNYAIGRFHSKSGNDSMEIVRRAETVLRQPNNSSPHSEHFHVRFYCELHERLLGCQDFGAKHAHVDGFSEDVKARIDDLIELYSSGVPEERAYALSQLDLLTTEPEDQEESEMVDAP